ncbi:hypothetical protein PRUPE_3G067000 [Prunus persica]|uniref:Uncharacterized protein n=1 Tax=Prunus persica TaxID=3760 RepID=M5X9G7_PRUPE|nr:hypothetical protein PRUPE_3G067000 [Prunus persica]
MAIKQLIDSPSLTNDALCFVPIVCSSFTERLWNISFIVFCRVHLEYYTSDYTAQVLLGYYMVYIFMTTFMIPGTVFMSLLVGSLFGVFRGIAFVVFNATTSASSCYFLSKLIGRPIVFSLWPDKLQNESFIFLPVDVPYHIFFIATIIGLILARYVTVRVGLALGDLRSHGDLYDFNSIATLFFIGVVSVTPMFVASVHV